MSDTTDPAILRLLCLQSKAPFTLLAAPYFDERTWTHSDCRLFAGEDACTPPHLSPPSLRRLPPSSGGIIKEQSMPWCMWYIHRLIYAFLLVFSCNWWNWKQFNSLTWFTTYKTCPYARIFVHKACILYTFCMKNGCSVHSNWVLAVCSFF